MVFNLKGELLDWFFPPRCPVCNEITVGRKLGMCNECEENITYVTEPYCMKCGKPLSDEGDEFCNDCAEKKHNYDEGRAALVYDEYMSKSIYRFKYNSRREYAGIYGRIIYERLGRKISSWNCDGIVPVPIHKSRMKQRGYNQAQLIARELSKHTGIPMFDGIVARRNDTKVQKNLSAKERENNLKKAFIVYENSVKLRSVIIVDDIYTTGSTIDAVALCLKDAGVEHVYFAALSIGRGY